MDLGVLEEELEEELSGGKLGEEGDIGAVGDGEMGFGAERTEQSGGKKPMADDEVVFFRFSSDVEEEGGDEGGDFEGEQRISFDIFDDTVISGWIFLVVTKAEIGEAFDVNLVEDFFGGSMGDDGGENGDLGSSDFEEGLVHLVDEEGVVILSMKRIRARDDEDFRSIEGIGL